MAIALRASEWIVIVYLACLAAVALATRVPRDRRRHVVATAATGAATIFLLAWIGRGGAAQVARDWMPLLYLLLGYRLPANLVIRGNAVLERALLTCDNRSFGREGLAGFEDRAPRSLVELLELAYLFCYPLVPLGFGLLYFGGPSDETDRFWTAVLLAGYACYGVLPWLATRPPRVLETRPGRPRPVTRTLNLYVLDRASVQWNTFPSGHAAIALATALTVLARRPIAGLVLMVAAVAVVIGSVVGRYHYAADAVAGAAVAVVSFLVSRTI